MCSHEGNTAGRGPDRRAFNQVFHGWVGDIRAVNRPLRVDEFMIA